MYRTFAVAALATAMSTAAIAATESTDLTVYRSPGDSLFSAASRGSMSSGYATVHETRTLNLEAGQHVVNIDGLPEQLDTEAVQLRFPDRPDIHTLASRIMLADGNGLLARHIGERVYVNGKGGELLADGILLGVDGGLVIDAGKHITLVRDYASVGFAESGSFRAGIRLQQTIQTERGGNATASLDYPTGGIGWRASYDGVLRAKGEGCQLELASLASIANRSGRDWQAATLKLVAGEPRFSGSSGPRPMMMARSVAADAPAPEALPQQQAMGDYRSYTLDGALTLPDNSITQVPLYRVQHLDCERRHVFENGNTWRPSRPQTAYNFNASGNSEVRSDLQFKAFENLPAGTLRVTGVFGDNREFLGSAQVADTPKGQSVEVTLGTTFSLRGTRERTNYALDKSSHSLDEAFRITLTNSGDEARHITVREHPDRWHQWTLVSSSTKPAQKSSGTLEFNIEVPAGGSATLDYALRYQWSSSDES